MPLPVEEINRYVYLIENIVFISVNETDDSAFYNPGKGERCQKNDIRMALALTGDGGL